MDPNQGNQEPLDQEVNTEDQFGDEMDSLLAGNEPSSQEVGSEADETKGTEQNEDPNAPPLGDKPGSTADATGSKDLPAEGKPSNDIWANAPEELRAAHEATVRDHELELGTARGHQSAADRQNQQLMQQLREASDGKESGSTDHQAEGDQKPEQGKTNSFDDVLNSDSMKSAMEDYGDVLGPMVELMKSQQGQISQMQKPLQDMTTAQQNAHIDNQYNLLNDAHSDWREVATDQRFQGWIATQPSFVQNAFEANRETVVNGQDAAGVIGMFKNAVGSNPITPTPTPEIKPNPKREAQLDASRDHGGSNQSAPIQRGVPQDFDGAADAFMDAADKRNGTNK